MANKTLSTCWFCLILISLMISVAHADGDLNKVKHIIIVMQENHSFDNYFGVLAYAPGHPTKAVQAA
jgi:phospholipase C